MAALITKYDGRFNPLEYNFTAEIARDSQDNFLVYSGEDHEEYKQCWKKEFEALRKEIKQIIQFNGDLSSLTDKLRFRNTLQIFVNNRKELPSYEKPYINFQLTQDILKFAERHQNYEAARIVMDHICSFAEEEKFSRVYVDSGQPLAGAENLSQPPGVVHILIQENLKKLISPPSYEEVTANARDDIPSDSPPSYESSEAEKKAREIYTKYLYLLDLKMEVDKDIYERALMNASGIRYMRSNLKDVKNLSGDEVLECYDKVTARLKKEAPTSIPHGQAAIKSTFYYNYNLKADDVNSKFSTHLTLQQHR